MSLNVHKSWSVYRVSNRERVEKAKAEADAKNTRTQEFLEQRAEERAQAAQRRKEAGPETCVDFMYTVTADMVAQDRERVLTGQSTAPSIQASKPGGRTVNPELLIDDPAAKWRNQRPPKTDKKSGEVPSKKKKRRVRKVQKTNKPV